MSYIIVDSIWKKYEIGTSYIYALKDVSFKIDRGKTICILGPNGSGKTTLLKVMAGYIKPDSGSIYIDNMDLTRLSDDQLALFRRRHIGFIFQEDILLDSLSVYENLELGLRPYFKDRFERRDRIYKALDRLGIKDLANRLYGGLSEGERRKVSIAMATAGDPDILFADEPTTHLDEEGVDEVIKIIDELSRSGVTVIIATHDPLIADMIRDRIILRNGKIVGKF